MGMIIVRRTMHNESLFKSNFMRLLRICEPDEVYISSGYFYDRFWEDNNGNILEGLLSGKNVTLAIDSRIVNNTQEIKNHLQDALGPTSIVSVYEHYSPDSNMRSNEIQLYRNGRDIAGIVGSSNCTTRDLGSSLSRSRKYNTFFDFQTDIIYFDSSYDEDIITDLFGPDSELHNVHPNQVSIEIFGIERRPNLELDIMDTNLKTFITRSGFFREI